MRYFLLLFLYPSFPIATYTDLKTSPPYSPTSYGLRESWNGLLYNTSTRNLLGTREGKYTFKS